MTAMNGRASDLPCKRTFQDVVRHFTPAWFAVTMDVVFETCDRRSTDLVCARIYSSSWSFLVGTGSISMLFHTFPYHNDSTIMKLLSLGLFFLNLVLFVLFTILSIARYVLFPNIWARMLRHPAQSLYLGTFPMSATTLFTVSIVLIYETYHFGGQVFVYAIWALWWLDAAVSIMCCWGMVHIMITCQDHPLHSMTLAWLLPVVTLVTGASAGSIIAQALMAYTPNGALVTFTISACMVVIGLALTVMLLTVYLLRTISHGYSEGPAIVSVFFPLSPSGQGAMAVLLIGSGFKSLLPLTHREADGLLGVPSTGEIINVLCVVTAFALWCFGTTWMISALLGLWHSLRKTRVPFRLTFWSMIFPNGVYANCTLKLATTFSSPFFRVWGATHAVVTLVLWIYVVVQTIRLCPSGRIFDALPMEEDIGRSDVDETKSVGC